jgi:hypothetical protein
MYRFVLKETMFLFNAKGDFDFSLQTTAPKLKEFIKDGILL